MSNPPAEPSGPSRITHGAVVVLAYLHERDAACSDIARETSLAESTAYRWLTELEKIDLIEAHPTRRGGRALVEYSLDDEAVGAAAQVVVDRLVAEDAIP